MDVTCTAIEEVRQHFDRELVTLLVRRGHLVTQAAALIYNELKTHKALVANPGSHS